MINAVSSDHWLKVFISYSRRDLEAAEMLVAALEANDISVLIDRRDLPYGEEWQKELADFMRMSDTIVWLVSPDSVKSKWVNWELGEVVRLSKRLIPVQVRVTDPITLPEALGKIHLLPADDPFEVGRDLQSLVDTLNADRAWLKEATRLADRARQWFSKERDSGLLLHGRAIADAEAWERSRPRSAPPVSSEIMDLMLSSRRAAARRQRRFVIVALGLAVLGFGLAFISWQQRNAALANQSTYLAKLSKDSLDAGDVGTSLLLAMSALPKWRFGLDRPFLPEAGRSLNDAVLAMREARVLSGHGADVNTASLSHDDHFVLTGSDDGTARLWNAQTGSVAQTFGPHKGKVLKAILSPDGQSAATVAQENDIHVWDTSRGKAGYALSGHTGQVTSIEFADAGMLISASLDGTARIWRLGGPGGGTVLRGHKAGVNSAAFSPDKKRAVTASDDGTSIVWEVDSARPILSLPGHERAALGALYDPSGSTIATYSEDRTVRIWDAASGETLAIIPDIGSPITSLAFCPIGNCLIVTAIDGTARLHDARSGDLRFELKGHSQAILKASVSRNGKFAATVGRGGETIVWEVETGRMLLALGGHAGDVFDVSFANSGEFLVTASRDRTARIWRVPAPTTTRLRANLETGFRSIDIRPDGQMLALGGYEGTVQLLDGSSLRKAATARLGEEITLVKFDSAGARLLVGTSTGSVFVLSVPTLERLSRASTDGSEIGNGAFAHAESGFTVVTVSGARFDFDGPKSGQTQTLARGSEKATLVAAVSPGASRVLFGHIDGAAVIVDAARQAPIPLNGHKGAILHAVFDEKERIAITASEDGTARIWEVATGAPLQVLSGGKSPVTFVAISSDGRYVATASPDRTVRLWRIGVPSPIAVYGGHLGGVDLVRFLPDGSGLVSAADDGEVHQWGFSDDYRSMLSKARSAVPRCLTEQQIKDFGLGVGDSEACGRDAAGGAAAAIPTPPIRELEARR